MTNQTIDGVPLLLCPFCLGKVRAPKCRPAGHACFNWEIACGCGASYSSENEQGTIRGWNLQRALLATPAVESELVLKVQTENYEALKATQPQGVPEIPKHLNYATVLVLQEGESEYGEALYGRDGEFRFGYDESALTDVEKWMPLPRRETPAPESINHGACVDFRLLLNKYIEHVGQCEGVDFIDDIGGAYGSDVPFDLAEIAELERLQEYPMKELVALPNDSDTNVPLIGLTPKGSAKVHLMKREGAAVAVEYYQNKINHLKQLLRNVRATPHFSPEDVLAIDGALREDEE